MNKSLHGQSIIERRFYDRKIIHVTYENVLMLDKKKLYDFAWTIKIYTNHLIILIYRFRELTYTLYFSCIIYCMSHALYLVFVL